MSLETNTVPTMLRPSRKSDKGSRAKRSVVTGCFCRLCLCTIIMVEHSTVLPASSQSCFCPCTGVLQRQSLFVSFFHVLICDSMRRLVPRLGGRQKRRNWQGKLPSERLLHALKSLISSKGLPRKHFLRTLNLMTPQMMSLHHQTRTRFLPELLRTQCCSFIFAALAISMQHSIYCTPHVYNVYMDHPQ